MGNKESKAFTEMGIRNIYLSLLLVVPSSILIFITFFTGHPVIILTTFAISIMIILILFIKGMGDMLSGREELGEKHSYSVILATILSSSAIVVFLFLIVLILFSFSSLISLYTTVSIDAGITFLLTYILMIVISVVFRILIGLGLIFFIKEIIPEKKSLLWFSFITFIIYPVIVFIPILNYLAMCALGLIAFILPVVLYIICYRKAYQKIFTSEIKATPLIPCPFCNRVIPINSTFCRHCETKFKVEKHRDELDPRLNMDVPKPEYESPNGYTPVVGPTESQKRRLMTIISIIIVLIVVGAALFVIFSKSDTERFIGEWRMEMPAEISAVLGDDVGTISYTLYENRSMKFSYIDNEGYEIATSKSWGEWGVKDNKFYTFDPATQEGSLYDTTGVSYMFSNDDKTFEIEFDFGTTEYSVKFNKET